MARCEECLHYELCSYNTYEQAKYFGRDKEIYITIKNNTACKFFKPTADVAPRSEVDKLEYTLLGVMHSVDKWLEGEELEQDEVNRAITMREKTLQIIENTKSEVAREIFAEIDSILKAHTTEQHYRGERFIPKSIDIGIERAIADLKKKYGG